MAFVCVLDACVIYPFSLRDVLLQAAASGLYQACWSELILDEALRNLVAKGMAEEKAASLAATMRRAFPEAQVTDFEALIPAMRNDVKDRHVTAAAVKAGAQVIVTSNLRDFYDLPHGIEAQSPDEFLCNLLDLDPAKMARALTAIVARRRAPPTTTDRLVTSLAEVCPDFGAAIRPYL